MTRNYEVGRGKPTKHTQFKKGQSGYPSGRPKGRPNVRTMMEKTLLQPISVTEGGKKKKITLLELAIRQVANKAAKGDERALRALLQLSAETAKESESRRPIVCTITPEEAKF
jgi:hypothetical protein